MTRIFIDLESVSDGLSKTWDEMSRKARKFKGFFRPKSGDLQKKRSSPKFRVIFRPNPTFKAFFRPKLGDLQKKRSSPKFRVIFRPKSEIQRFFPPKIRWSPKKKKKKKKVFTKIETDISSNFANSDVWGGAVFEWGGAIFHFSHKIGLKSTKNMRFCILHKPMGGLEPPPPPPGYATENKTMRLLFRWSQKIKNERSSRGKLQKFLKIVSLGH